MRGLSLRLFELYAQHGLKALEAAGRSEASPPGKAPNADQ